MKPNALRDAILDAIDAKDEAVRGVGEAGMRHAVMARSRVVLAAALPDATDAHVSAALASDDVQRPVLAGLIHAALVADRHAREHVAAVRKAAPGVDLGPVRRSDLEARRQARIVGGK